MVRILAVTLGSLGLVACTPGEVESTSDLWALAVELGDVCSSGVSAVFRHEGRMLVGCEVQQSLFIADDAGSWEVPFAGSTVRGIQQASDGRIYVNLWGGEEAGVWREQADGAFEAVLVQDDLEIPVDTMSYARGDDAEVALLTSGVAWRSEGSSWSTLDTDDTTNRWLVSGEVVAHADGFVGVSGGQLDGRFYLGDQESFVAHDGMADTSVLSAVASDGEHMAIAGTDDFGFPNLIVHEGPISSSTALIGQPLEGFRSAATVADVCRLEDFIVVVGESEGGGFVWVSTDGGLTGYLSVAAGDGFAPFTACHADGLGYIATSVDGSFILE